MIRAFGLNIKVLLTTEASGGAIAESCSRLTPYRPVGTVVHVDRAGPS
jgi:hypothetical protein